MSRYVVLTFVFIVMTKLLTSCSFTKSSFLTKKICSRRLLMTTSPNKLCTEVKFSKCKFSLDYNSNVIFIGSCFSENMSAELKKYKFTVCTNPQGIIFNPVSISSCLSNVINNKVFTVSDTFRDAHHPDICHSWQHHTSFSALDSTDMVKNMNAKISNAHEMLTKANVVYLTLGTAFVHMLTNSQNLDQPVIVSNCHKQPPSIFMKRLLAVSEIMSSLDQAVYLCKEFNPSIKIVFTISPVRHSREGLIENSRSKAHLLTAVHEVIDKYPEFVSYFPAYEYLIDELRDYRYYSDDLVHPSVAAVNKVFDKFVYCYINDSDNTTLRAMRDIGDLLRDISHRPHFAGSTAYRVHVAKTLEKAKQLHSQYSQTSDISFSSEIEALNATLSALPLPLPLSPASTAVE